MAKAIEAGMPKLRIEEAAARTQARIDSGEQTVVGVNKYQAARTRHAIDVLKVDNATVRRLQIDKLKRLRGERDQSDVEAALDGADAIGAAKATATCWRSPSTPRAPRPPSAKSRDALEKVFGRHRRRDQVDLRRL